MHRRPHQYINASFAQLQIRSLLPATLCSLCYYSTLILLHNPSDSVSVHLNIYVPCVLILECGHICRGSTGALRGAEVNVVLNESVRDCDVFVIQQGSQKQQLRPI